MPKVLTKLRVDEVSCVTAGAGEGTRVVLMKRDDRKRRKAFGYAMPEPSFYAKLFGARPQFAKATYRGGSGRRLHHIQNLTREESKHFLLHDPHGRQLQRDFPNIPFDELADHLVEASSRPSEKRKRNSNEVNNMSDHLVEVCKSVVSGDVEPPSEHELVAEIKKLANANRKPGETSAAAFTRIYTAQDDDGLVLRKAVQVAKGHPHPHVGARS